METSSDRPPRKPDPSSPQQMVKQEEHANFHYFLQVAATSALLMAGILTLIGYGHLSVIFLVAGAGMLMLRLLGLTPRSTPWLRIVNQVALLFCTTTALYTAWHSGGRDSFALWFLPIIPLMAAFLCRPAVASIWTFAILAVVVGIWLLDSHPATAAELGSPALRLMTLTVLIYLVAAFSRHAKHASDERIEQLSASLEATRQAREEAEAANRTAEAARREAEAANEVKSSFLAVMSHELRTPLNAVIGLGSLLRNEVMSEQGRRHAELIRSSGEGMLQLINDILSFSKSDAGQLELEHIAFDLHRTAQEAVALVAGQAVEKRLQLTCEMRAPKCLVGDPERLRQVLLNLLGNAVKFTPTGRVELRVEELGREGNRCRVRIEVRDTGIGISQENQGRLFQPFTQADVSTTRRFGGTGLGLAISKRLVELMGGRIGFDSVLGQGSTFWMELPFELAPESQLPVARPQPAGPAPSFQGRRILVVEDNPINQTVTEAMLARLGCIVASAADGQQAVDDYLAQPQDYDLILMDCDMPVMDGFAASRAIRAGEPAGRRVPIIALTAAAFESDRKACFAAGMDDFLPKPIRLDDIERMLRQWLGDAAAPHDAGPSAS